MSHHTELYKFAEELVDRSKRAIRHRNLEAYAGVRKARGEDPLSPAVRQDFYRLLPDAHNAPWDIGPYGVFVRINEEGDMKTCSLGEFITDISIAFNNRSPAPRDVETVIFHIGNLIGKLE